jgi:hypothetical protein
MDYAAMERLGKGGGWGLGRRRRRGEYRHSRVLRRESAVKSSAQLYDLLLHCLCRPAHAAAKLRLQSQ